jgi:hypothetical protein
MARHTNECRERGIPFAADPSQQVAWLSGEDIANLIDGAAYLFTNEYEAAVVEKKTGWSAADIAGRVDVRVITLGAQGARIEERGEQPVHIPVAAVERVVGPVSWPAGPGTWASSAARRSVRCSPPTWWRRWARRSTNSRTTPSSSG